MITDSELQEKIKAWVREYGPGPDTLPHESTQNFLKTLIDHKGFVPSSRGYVPTPVLTIGDEVENAVRMMAATPGEAGTENVLFKCSVALREYYLCPREWDEEKQLRALRALGLPMSRAKFYECVRLARAFLAGYLNGRNRLAA
jgi:hypothetical protein